MRILFLCVANSARRQMAEGLARRGVGTRASVQVHALPGEPFAMEVLREIGVDLTSHSSKFVETIDPTTVDLVIKPLLGM